MRYFFILPVLGLASDLSDAVTLCDTTGKAVTDVSAGIKLAPNAEAKCIINAIDGKNAVFVDVRGSKGPQEFGAGHCSSAVNIAWPKTCWTPAGGSWEKDTECKAFVDQMTSLVRGEYTTPVVVHCVSGNRAGQIAKFLTGQSWTDSKTGKTFASTYTDPSKLFKEFVTTNGGYADICDSTEKGQNNMADLVKVCGNTSPDALQPAYNLQSISSVGGSIKFVNADIGKCMIDNIGSKDKQSDAGGSVKFVDVRGAKEGEWEAGHCDSAYQCSWPGDACWKDSTSGSVTPACQTFMTCMEEVVGGDYTTEIFILCKSGNRAGQVARFLQGADWFNKKCEGTTAECTFSSSRTTNPFKTFVVSEANGGTACPAGAASDSQTADDSGAVAATATTPKKISNEAALGIIIGAIVGLTGLCMFISSCSGSKQH